GSQTYAVGLFAAVMALTQEQPGRMAKAVAAGLEPMKVARQEQEGDHGCPHAVDEKCCHPSSGIALLPSFLFLFQQAPSLLNPSRSSFFILTGKISSLGVNMPRRFDRSLTDRRLGHWIFKTSR